MYHAVELETPGLALYTPSSPAREAALPNKPMETDGRCAPPAHSQGVEQRVFDRG